MGDCLTGNNSKVLDLEDGGHPRDAVGDEKPNTHNTAVKAIHYRRKSLREDREVTTGEVATGPHVALACLELFMQFSVA